LDDVIQGEDTHALLWNGKDEGGVNLVPDGKYMIVINAATELGESCQGVTECVVCKFDESWTPGEE
jgi:hypothetical protein